MNIPYKDYNEILLKVLEAIDYIDDKEAFIKQFIAAIYSQSLTDLIQSLAVSDQEKIKQEMNDNSDSSEKINKIIKKYFTEEQSKNALGAAAKNTMVGYLSTIQDTLLPLQEQNLINIFQELNTIS